MDILLAAKDYIQQDISYQVIKLSDNKIKIVIHWNHTPSAGHKIKIEDVIIEGDEIKVVYKKHHPKGDSINCQVITRPTDSWEGNINGNFDKYYITLACK